MNKFYSPRFLFFIAVLIAGVSMISCMRKTKARELPQRNEHEASEREKFDDPSGAAKWEFDKLKDKTGKIPANIRQQETEQARSIYAKQLRQRKTGSNLYTLQGPSNVGGRTRCVVYDVRYDGVGNRTLIAGGVSGGIYKSTDDGNTWMRKGSLNEIYTVTSIVQDPRPGHQNTWYYGTGEGIGSDDYHAAPHYMGDGVYKSTDNGETWNRLPNSNTGILESWDRNEDQVSRLAVNTQNGHVYMAAMSALYRSIDEGNTWSLVLGPDQFYYVLCSSDILITTNGRLFAAFSGFGGPLLDGVWTSVTGDPASWTRIAGSGSGGDPVGWEDENNYGRIVLASPASSPNFVYAFVQSFSDNCPPEFSRARLFKWDQLTFTWTNLSNNLPGCLVVEEPFNLQYGYNMVLAIKPDDPNVIFIGATNLYRSTDGFTTQNNITQIGGYSSHFIWNVHPDMHWIVFKPGDPLTMICGNDGGMQRTADDLASFVSWTTLNHNYFTTQFYFVAIDPRSGNNHIIGGMQDNGTYRGTGGPGSVYEWVNGGDGMSVGISKEINGNVYEYTSSQGAAMFRGNMNFPLAGNTYITPFNISYPTSFYTLFKLDADNTELLYYANNYQLFRTPNASTVNVNTWTYMTGVTPVPPFVGAQPQITALTTSRGNYAGSKSSLFIGTNYGQIFRLDDPANANPATVPANITGLDFSNLGYAYVSSISVNPRNDDTVMVTFSNYGLPSIWWTGNANSASPSWTCIERNLTLPSIRSSAIAVTASGVEYFVGTSVGLFHSNNPLTTDWNMESADGIGNALVSDLVLRTSDNCLLIGTYGNGLWTTTLSSPLLPVMLVDFTGKLQNDHAALRWSTATEYFTEVFQVQRSSNDVDYETIGSVRAVGNSNSFQAYQFTDPRIASDKNFYRLKIMDKDLKFELSPVILIRDEVKAQDIFVVNPFHDQIDLQFAKTPGSKVQVCLFDMNGKLVGKEELSNKTHTVLRFNNRLGLLRNGIYILQVRDGNTILKRKLFRQ